MTRILLIGSTGFIGRQILAAWSASTTPEPRVLMRNRSAGSDDSQFIGDLNHPASLQEAMDGIEIVVNATSYLGSDPEAAERLYLQGTANLLDAEARAGVSRCLQMSTAAVYGSGPHRGIGVLDQSANPESMISRHRSIADQMVLDAGGTVLRPYLVYGPADRWFIPGRGEAFPEAGQPNRAWQRAAFADQLGRAGAGWWRLWRWPKARSAASSMQPLPNRCDCPNSWRDRVADRSTGHVGLGFAAAGAGAARRRRVQPAPGQHDRRRRLAGAAPLWNRSGLPPSSFSLAEPATRAWYRSRIGT